MHRRPEWRSYFRTRPERRPSREDAHRRFGQPRARLCRCPQVRVLRRSRHRLSDYRRAVCRDEVSKFSRAGPTQPGQRRHWRIRWHVRLGAAAARGTKESSDRRSVGIRAGTPDQGTAAGLAGQPCLIPRVPSYPLFDRCLRERIKRRSQAWSQRASPACASVSTAPARPRHRCSPRSSRASVAARRRGATLRSPCAGVARRP